MTSLYRTIITKAWELTKRYKFLWLFGFFAAFLGNATEYQTLFNQINSINNQPEVYSSIVQTLSLYAQAIFNIWQLPLVNILAFVLTLLFIILVVLIFAWLAVTSQVAIIKNADKVNSGKDINFKDSFVDSVQYFWPAFGLNLLAKGIIFILLTLFVTPVLVILIAEGAKFAILFTLLTIIIFVPITIIITFVTKYAIAYLVLKGQKFWEAFKNGWRLFAANWLISIEMALIVLVINAALAFLLSIIGLLIVSPLIIIGLTSAIPQLFFVIFGMALIIVAILFFFAAAVFSTWQNSVWTLLFIKLNSGGAYAKIVRWVATRIAKKES